MDITAIFGVLDKALGLIGGMVNDRPKLKQREINGLFKLQESLRLEIQKPKHERDLVIVANLMDKLEAEIDRLRETSNA